MTSCREQICLLIGHSSQIYLLADSIACLMTGQRIIVCLLTVHTTQVNLSLLTGQRTRVCMKRRQRTLIRLMRGMKTMIPLLFAVTTGKHHQNHLIRDPGVRLCHREPRLGSAAEMTSSLHPQSHPERLAPPPARPQRRPPPTGPASWRQMMTRTCL